MADFAAVLRKTIGALSENTPETRAKVYEKARATIEAKLAAVSPPPSQQLADRQRALLEDAIANVESEYAAPPPEAPEDDLESIFAELDAAAAHGSAADRTEEAGVAESQTEEPAAPLPSDEASADEVGSTPPPPADPVHEDLAYRETADEYGQEPPPPDPVGGDEDGQAPEWLQPGTTYRAIDGQSMAPLAPASETEAEDAGHAFARQEERGARRGVGALVVTALVLIALAAAGYGGWHYRDDLATLAGFQSFEQMVGQTDEAASPAETAEAEQAAATGEETAEADSEPAARKFTQRLLPDGREVDEGPAGDEPELGEGTSVAEATVPDGSPAEAGQTDEAAPDAGAALPVGQRAIFYEERTSVSEGSAERGTVVWSLVEESPGDNLPAEPAVRGEVTVPGKGVQLKITIRRNVDQSLPASHIVELIFLTPDDFEGGGIQDVRRLAMKRSEQDTGSPLLGIPAKIADGFFLVALSDNRADLETNRLLMRRQSWIDIPIVYASGRRALITMEKGTPGQEVFDEALAAWERASSG